MCVFLYSVNKIYHSRNAGPRWESDLWCVKMHKEPKAEALSDTQTLTVPYPAALTWLRDLTPLLSLSLSVSLSRFPPCWIYLSQTFRRVPKIVLRSFRTNINETSKILHF